METKPGRSCLHFWAGKRNYFSSGCWRGMTNNFDMEWGWWRRGCRSRRRCWTSWWRCKMCYRTELSLTDWWVDSDTCGLINYLIVIPVGPKFMMMNNFEFCCSFAEGYSIAKPGLPSVRGWSAGHIPVSGCVGNSCAGSNWSSRRVSDLFNYYLPDISFDFKAKRKSYLCWYLYIAHCKLTRKNSKYSTPELLLEWVLRSFVKCLDLSNLSDWCNSTARHWLFHWCW